MEDDQRKGHGACYYASMFIWRILMALLSGTFSAMFLRFLIKMFANLHSGNHIKGSDIAYIMLALLFALILIPLTLFFVSLGFLELKNMFRAFRVSSTTEEINFTTLSEARAEEQWRRSVTDQV